MPALSLFLALLIFFHSSEFALAFIYQRQELSFSCENFPPLLGPSCVMRINAAGFTQRLAGNLFVQDDSYKPSVSPHCSNAS